MYIDLNIFDSAEKLRKYLAKYDDGNDNIIGMIPKNRETLRELMQAFYVFVDKDKMWWKEKINYISEYFKYKLTYLRIHLLQF